MSRLREEYGWRTQQAWFAALASVGMVVLNFVLIPGAAVIALAPIGWLLHALRRRHAIGGYLARQAGSPAAK